MASNESHLIKVSTALLGIFATSLVAIIGLLWVKSII